MILEGMNININDIEDDDLRKEVIKYFKTFKKGKLDDEDLSDDDENDNDEDENDKEFDDELDLGNMSDDKLKELLTSLDDESKSELLDDLKSNLNNLEGKEKEGVKKVIKIIQGEKISECLVNESLSILGVVIATATATAITKAIKSAEIRKTTKNLEELIEKEKDEDKKKELEKKLHDYKLATYKNGKPVVNRKVQQQRLENLKDLNKIDDDFKIKNIKSIQREAESLSKDNKQNDKNKEEKKDSEGNILKKEEITDKDGKKKTVTTHTGPRGGKFYWPAGSPKDSKHKVYIGKGGKVKECMDLKEYLQESIDNFEKIDEVAWIGTTMRYVGTILLSTVIPYLISLGIRIATLKIDNWVNQLIKKYPNHKDAILLIAQVLKEDLDKCKKSKELINNSEHQKPSSYYKLSDYEDEILNCIQSEEDKEKVKNLFKLINSDDFKEEIDECLIRKTDNIFEGLFDK